MALQSDSCMTSLLLKPGSTPPWSQFTRALPTLSFKGRPLAGVRGRPLNHSSGSLADLDQAISAAERILDAIRRAKAGVITAGFTTPLAVNDEPVFVPAWGQL